MCVCRAHVQHAHACSMSASASIEHVHDPCLHTCESIRGHASQFFPQILSSSPPVRSSRILCATACLCVIVYWRDDVRSDPPTMGPHARVGLPLRRGLPAWAVSSFAVRRRAEPMPLLSVLLTLRKSTAWSGLLSRVRTRVVRPRRRCRTGQPPPLSLATHMLRAAYHALPNALSPAHRRERPRASIMCCALFQLLRTLPATSAASCHAPAASRARMLLKMRSATECDAIARSHHPQTAGGRQTPRGCHPPRRRSLPFVLLRNSIATTSLFASRRCLIVWSVAIREASLPAAPLLCYTGREAPLEAQRRRHRSEPLAAASALPPTPPTPKPPPLNHRLPACLPASARPRLSTHPRRVLAAHAPRGSERGTAHPDEPCVSVCQSTRQVS